MKLSTRTRYGIRAAIELACNYGAAPLNIKKIAEKQEISEKYLEQLMTLLKSAGFVRSVRGAKGGFVLSKKPEDIDVCELFIALEGPLVTSDCLDGEGKCPRANDCAAREVWKDLQTIVNEFLESLTLADLVKKTKRSEKPFYQI